MSWSKIIILLSIYFEKRDIKPLLNFLQHGFDYFFFQKRVIYPCGYFIRVEPWILYILIKTEAGLDNYSYEYNDTHMLANEVNKGVLNSYYQNKSLLRMMLFTHYISSLMMIKFK
jgi:hypothetical protein